MKKIIVIFFILISNFSIGKVHVRGYYKKNGTYVAPYVRSSPNSTVYDNYSYPGNTNPYTGKTATGNQSSFSQNTYSTITTKSNTIWVNGYWCSSPNTQTNTFVYSSESNHNNKPTQSNLTTPLLTNYSVNKTYKVNYSFYHVFIEPNVASKIIATLNLGDTVRVIDINNSNWLKISFNYYNHQTFTSKPTIGYVYGDYSTLIDTVTLNSNTTSIKKYNISNNKPEEYSIDEFYKKIELDIESLDEDGNEIEYIFQKTDLKPGKYQIEITDGPGELYEIKGSDYFIKFRGYYGYAGYADEGILDVGNSSYSSTFYKKE